ncbi:MAG: hypothetical protein QM784_17405 [Polyangiaceae bacterium]
MKSITKPDGTTALVDDATVSYLESTAPPPNQESLALILEKTARIEVVRGGSSNGIPHNNEVLAATEDPNTIERLRHALQIRDGGCGHCMCHGDPTLVLSDRRGDRLAVLGVHHGIAIRWCAWKDDAELADGRQLLQWLLALGIAYPMEQFEADRLRTLESQARAERWQAAAPAPLAAHPVLDIDLALNPAPLIPVLEDAYPDPRVRALALLEWFGHGAGPWSGFPAYEQLPENLLLALPIGCLLDALNSEPLTSAQLEGAARLFAGWTFGKTRRRDLKRLTPSNRKRLLDHALSSTDRDKQARARKAFDPNH